MHRDRRTWLIIFMMEGKYPEITTTLPYLLIPCPLQPVNMIVYLQDEISTSLPRGKIYAIEAILMSIFLQHDKIA